MLADNLVDVSSPSVEKIILVLDNLSMYTPAAFIDGTHLITQKEVNGTNTQFASIPFSATSRYHFILLCRP
jgi:hypothetical protein